MYPTREFREGWNDFIKKQLGIKIYRDVDWNEFWYGVADDLAPFINRQPFWAKSKPLSAQVKEAAIVPVPKGASRSDALARHFSAKSLKQIRKGFEAMLSHEYDRAEEEGTDTSLWYEETVALIESMKAAERKAR